MPSETDRPIQASPKFPLSVRKTRVSAAAPPECLPQCARQALGRRTGEILTWASSGGSSPKRPMPRPAFMRQPLRNHYKKPRLVQIEPGGAFKRFLRGFAAADAQPNNRRGYGIAAAGGRYNRPLGLLRNLNGTQWALPCPGVSSGMRRRFHSSSANLTPRQALSVPGAPTGPAGFPIIPGRGPSGSHSSA